MARVEWNEEALRQLLTSPDGEIARDLNRRAFNVENQAKVNASGRPGPRVRTGRLRSSITHEVLVDEKGLVARVGTNVEYGYYLETGLRNGVTYKFLEPALPAAQL
jgi:phage gpG-like protein